MGHKHTAGSASRTKRIARHCCPRCAGKLVEAAQGLHSKTVTCVSCGWNGGLFEATQKTNKRREPGEDP